MSVKKVLTFLIKSDIKQTAKDVEILGAKIENTKLETKELTDNFGIFGLTVGKVKKQFNNFKKVVTNNLKVIGLQIQLAGKAFQLMFGGKVRMGAKELFRLITKGIATTGIGLFALALGSVVTFLTKTKKGAELLERTLAGLGAAFNVIRERVSGLGEGILKLFGPDRKQGLQDIKDSFKGIGDEIVADTKAIVELKKSFQDLRDSNRELRVETATSKAKIEELRLIATDTSKSIQERQDAANQAFDIENKLLDKRIANAKEAIRIQKEENKTAINKDEALDALADKEVELANLELESSRRKIRLTEKLNGIRRQGEAEERKALKDLKKADQERTGTLEKLPSVQENLTNKIIQSKNDEVKAVEDGNAKIIQSNAEVTDQYLQDIEDKKAAEKGLDDFKAFAADQALNITRTLMETEVQEVEEAYQREIELAGGNKDAQDKINKKFEKKRAQLAKKQKAFDIAQATVDTFKAANAAYNSMAGIPIVGQVLAPIAAGLAVTAGLANVRKIAKQDTGGGAGGGGGGGGGGLGGGTPAPDMQSGKFELSQPAQEQEPVKAFVVTDDVTEGQDKLSTIRRNAVI